MNAKLNVVSLCFYLLSIVAFNSEASRDKKQVVVTTLQQQKHMDVYIPEHKVLNELLNFQQQNQQSSPQLVLKAFYNFQQAHPQLSENHEFYLALVESYLALSMVEEALGLIEYLSEQALTKESALQLSEAKVKLHVAKNDYYLAIEQQLQLLQHLDHQQQDAIRAMLNLANLYWQLDLANEAQVWQNKAVEKVAQLDDFGFELEFYSQLVELQKKAERYDEAIAALSHLIEKVAAANMWQLESHFRMQRADTFLMMKEYAQAKAEHEQVFNLATQKRDYTSQFSAVLGLMENYINQGEFQQATKLQVPANVLDRKSYSSALKNKYALLKAKLSAEKGEYSHAVTLLKKYLSEQDENPLLTHELKQVQAQWLTLSGQTQLAVDQFLQLLIQQQEQQQHVENRKIKYWQQQHANNQLQLMNLETSSKQMLTAQQQQNVLQLEQLKSGYRKIIALLLFAFVLLLSYYAWFKKIAKRDSSARINTHNQFITDYQTSIEQASTTGLVLVNFDQLKQLNQNLGHDNADHLISVLLNAIQHRIGLDKSIYKLSAGKYLVLAKNFTQYQAFLLAEIIRKELNITPRPFTTSNEKVSASLAYLSLNEHRDIESIKDALIQAVKLAQAQGGDTTLLASNDKIIIKA